MTDIDDYIQDTIKQVLNYIGVDDKQKQYIALVEANNRLCNKVANHFMYKGSIYPSNNPRHSCCANLHPDLYEAAELLLSYDEEQEYRINLIVCYLQELLFTFTEPTQLNILLPSAVYTFLSSKLQSFLSVISRENKCINNNPNLEFLKNKHAKAYQFMQEYLALKLLT